MIIERVQETKVAQILILTKINLKPLNFRRKYKIWPEKIGQNISATSRSGFLQGRNLPGIKDHKQPENWIRGPKDNFAKAMRKLRRFPNKMRKREGVT